MLESIVYDQWDHDGPVELCVAGVLLQSEGFPVFWCKECKTASCRKGEPHEGIHMTHCPVCNGNKLTQTSLVMSNPKVER